MICSMVKAKKHGLIKVIMKELTKMERRMVRASIGTQMDQFTRENGLRIKLKAMESTLGLIIKFIMDNGLIIICMDKEFSIGPTAENMKENI